MPSIIGSILVMQVSDSDTGSDLATGMAIDACTSAGMKRPAKDDHASQPDPDKHDKRLRVGALSL